LAATSGVGEWSRGEDSLLEAAILRVGAAILGVWVDLQKSGSPFPVKEESKGVCRGGRRKKRGKLKKKLKERRSFVSFPILFGPQISFVLNIV